MYNIYIMYVPDVVIFPLLTLIPRRSPLIFFCRQNRVLDAELLALSHHDVVGDAWQEVEKLWARHVVRIDELFWKLPASPQHDQVPGEKGSKYNEGLHFITREIHNKRDFSNFPGVISYWTYRYLPNGNEVQHKSGGRERSHRDPRHERHQKVGKIVDSLRSGSHHPNAVLDVRSRVLSAIHKNFLFTWIIHCGPTGFKTRYWNILQHVLSD